MTKDFRVYVVKAIQIFLAAVIMLTISGLIFIYNRNQAVTVLDNHENTLDSKASRPIYEMQGYCFYGTQDGKTVISIKADRFSIQKKKIGFFRFGLINEAVFENAVVHLYGKRRRELEGEPGKSNQNLRFKEIFSKQLLQAFPKKRISAVRMKPVTIILHDEHTVVTRVRADSATLRFASRDIYFKGAVRMISGPRILMTDKLIMYPESGVVKTDKHFIMKTSEKQWEGNKLSIDVYLKSFTS